MREAPARHIAVVGGGISGLAAAWFLRRRSNGTTITMLESSDRVGGKLRLRELAGMPVDVGAESLLARRPEAVELAAAVGVDLLPAATTAASIWSRGRLRPVPSGTVMGVPSELAPLTRDGLLTRAEVARARLDHLLPRGSWMADASVAEVVRVRLGRAVLDRLVEPLVGGVYAGRADELSIRSTLPQLFAQLPGHRSLVAAAAAARAVPAVSGPVFVAPRGGVGLLPAALAAATGAEIRTGTAVREMHRTTAGWRLVTGSAADPQCLDVDGVVLALPPAPGARLLAAEVPTAAALLRQVPMASSAVVSLAFGADQVRLPAGSGLLVPPVERRLVKAATFSSTKWAWQAEAAPGLVLLRASVGRRGEEAVLQRDDPDLVDLVLADLRALIGLSARPVDATVTRWGGGLPQYTVGHADRVSALREAVRTVPSLVVCGAAYDGIGVPACIATADRAVTELLRQWPGD